VLPHTHFILCPTNEVGSGGVCSCVASGFVVGVEAQGD